MIEQTPGTPADRCLCPSTGRIPEEAKALSLLAPAAPPVPAILPGAGLLPIPIPTPSPVHNVSSPLFTFLRFIFVKIDLQIVLSVCIYVYSVVVYFLSGFEATQLDAQNVAYG